MEIHCGAGSSSVVRPSRDIGGKGIKDPCNIHTILPQPSHQTSGIYTSTPFIHHAATSQTDYENTFRRPRFPMLCTLCLELVGLKHYTEALLVDLNADLKHYFSVRHSVARLELSASA